MSVFYAKFSKTFQNIKKSKKINTAIQKNVAKFPKVALNLKPKFLKFY